VRRLRRLPGGIGTLDELFEAWTWNALGYHAKPFCLLNVNGFWDGLTASWTMSALSGFLSPRAARSCCVANAGGSDRQAGRSRSEKRYAKAWSGKTPGGGEAVHE
jgi:predicted Rossmann-fold nucleotide-binding protein